MKIFLVKNPDGSITQSNWPIKENGLESQCFEVSEDDIAAVQEGTLDWNLSDAVLTTLPSTRKSDAEAALKNQQEEAASKAAELQSLKTKLAGGSASLSEIQLALSKLI